MVKSIISPLFLWIVSNRFFFDLSARDPASWCSRGLLRMAMTSWTIAEEKISLAHYSTLSMKTEHENIRYKGRPGRVGYPSETSIPAFSNLDRAFEGRGKVALEGVARSLMAAEG